MAVINANALREALARVLGATPVPRVEIEADVTRTPARTVGQILQAQLVADLPNGRSLIDVEGFRFDVKLPLPVRVGQSLQLEVLALAPKLTFVLLGTPGGASADAVSMSDSVRHLAALLDGLSSETSAAPAEPHGADASRTARECGGVGGGPQRRTHAERALLRVASGAVDRGRASARRIDARAAGGAQTHGGARASASDGNRAAAARDPRYAADRLGRSGVARPVRSNGASRRSPGTNRPASRRHPPGKRPCD